MTESVEELAPGTWRIGSLFGGRNLFQYLIADGDEALLVDAGTARTPRDAILPALEALQIRPENVRTVVVTHPDLDHQGGLAGLLERLPAARAMCGFEDRPMVSDPSALIQDRYSAYRHDHHAGYPDDAIAAMKGEAGEPVEIDLALTGGETLRVGDRILDVRHAPGHSAGHLVLFEPATGMLFSSDAVHGAMCPDAGGAPALPPTYEEVDAYLRTVDLIAGLPVESMHSGHWPTFEGAEIAGFLDESRAFVSSLDEALLEVMEQPVTLLEVCAELDARLGPFGGEPVNLMFAVHGHLRRLCRAGRAAVVDTTAAPLRFNLVSSHKTVGSERG